MVLTQEQILDIKKQLFEQIQKFPEEQRNSINEQIESMSTEELEQFLIQNNLIKGESGEATEQSCIFCSITEGKISSYKIAESENAIAVLEINPISKGHILIIPKIHISSKEIEKQFSDLALSLKEKLIKEFSPKDVGIFISEFFGHGIINLIPIYKDETPKSPRQKSTPEELKEIQKKLELKEDTQINEAGGRGSQETKKQAEKIELPKITTIEAEKIWMPRRIP